MGARHRPHSARSCELAWRAVRVAGGHPGRHHHHHRIATLHHKTNKHYASAHKVPSSHPLAQFKLNFTS